MYNNYVLVFIARSIQNYTFFMINLSMYTSVTAELTPFGKLNTGKGIALIVRYGFVMNRGKVTE